MISAICAVGSIRRLHLKASRGFRMPSISSAHFSAGFSRYRKASPSRLSERTFNSKFFHFVDEHHKVMTKYLAECLVHHRCIRFGTQRGTELGLKHAKCGLGIRTLVIVVQEASPLEHEVVIHALPQHRAIPGDRFRSEGECRAWRGRLRWY